MGRKTEVQFNLRVFVPDSYSDASVDVHWENGRFKGSSKTVTGAITMLVSAMEDAHKAYRKVPEEALSEVGKAEKVALAKFFKNEAVTRGADSDDS
jgi:hypothetical protein